jgi:hypothetical protein
MGIETAGGSSLGCMGTDGRSITEHVKIALTILNTSQLEEGASEKMTEWHHYDITCTMG